MMTSSTKTSTSKVYLTLVDQWLDTLPAAESEDFREFAEVTPSIIEIWVYSGILGYEGTFNDLARWVKMKFKKLNRREILNSEIAALHAAHDKTRTIQMELLPEGGATVAAYGIQLTTTNQGYSMQIKLPDNIDVTKDVIVKWTYQSSHTGAADQFKRWVDTTKTDGSEVRNYNIQNAVGFNVNTVSGRQYTGTYTVVAADIEVGDNLLMLIRSNAVTSDRVVYSAVLQYEVV